ncbi:MAG: AAA family ATPase [Burkholderiales bacterium]|nr:AAA family ATPase [Burkholderiales bacterium]
MRVLVISAHETFRQQVQSACLRFTEAVVSLRLADTVGQGLELAHQIEAETIFLDLTRNVEAGLLAIEQLAEVKGRLVAASVDKIAPDLITRAIRAGAQEVLAQPVQDDEVHQILRKAVRLQSEGGGPARRQGRLIVTYSSKGGVGKTTITVNTAHALVQALGAGHVALVDANTQSPNVAAMLDLRPEHWLRDAVAEYRRIDPEMLRGFMTEHSSGLSVLAHSSDNPLELDFQEDQLSKILLVANGTYDFTLVDTFPILSSLNLAMMDLADHILLVTEAVVPAIRSARHNLQMLRQAGYSESRITVVINRYTRFRGNVPPDLVAETLDWPVEMVLPYDVHATIAANNGKTVIDAFPNQRLADGFRLLAARLTGEVVSLRARDGWFDRGRRLLLGRI